jgi:hypothetical protein
MKTISTLLAVAVVALMATPAHAVVVKETPGTLVAGDSGFYSTTVNNKFYEHDVLGALSSMSKITFTYDLTNTSENGGAAISSIGYTVTDPVFSASASAEEAGVSMSDVSSDHLILASAAMTTDFAGTTTITNLSKNRIINFTSTIAAYLTKGAQLTVSYAVTAVPLPAALPLFGLGIAALAGIRAKKKLQASA